MREKGASARKGPAALGGLDDVLAGKGEPVAPPAGAVARGAPAPAGPAREAAGEAEGRGLTSSTIHIPHYLSDRIRDYLHAHPEDTQTTLFFKGLVSMGIQVEPEDLEPKRRRRSR